MKPSDIAMSESFKLSKVVDDGVFESTHFKNLSAIGEGLREIVLLLSKHEKDIPEYQFNETEYDFYHDCSLYGVVAKGIYDFLESLSTIRTKDEDVRMLAIHLWMSVYFSLSNNEESKAIEEIQKRLNVHLFKKFEENLKELWYPALTRLWINLAGFQDKGEERGETCVDEKLYELLRKHYEKAVETDAEKASHMIPDKVRYDKEKGQLIQTWPAGNTTALNLRDGRLEIE